jgi:enoyl-CoA hydratase/carnithine racemase
MAGLVLREDADGVAVLTLNRPDVLNALSPKLFEELRAHVERLAGESESVGCVVLRGAGRSFSAGNDLNAIRAGERAPSPHFQAETLDALEALPQPVIASVQGHCYTGALELVLACDLLVVAESAKLADTHGKWGMTPTWGMSQRLPRRIGALRAQELMWTGRAIDGREAVALGLANHCFPDAELETKTLALARQIAANSWFTLRTEKSLVRGGAGLAPRDALAYERAHSPGAGPDMNERLKSFGKK